jgi:hypothetical protein
MGVGLAPKQLAQLRKLLQMMQGVKQLALGKPPQLNPEDVVDIIAQQIFDEFDSEKLGRISFDQFRAALRRMRINISEQDAKMLFAKVDDDHSGYIDKDEFKGVLMEVQERFRTLLVETLGLNKETIYIAVAWTAVWIAFLLAFIILGVYGFSDGSQFTAVITGVMPLFGTMARTLQDPNAMLSLVNKVDGLVVGFFARMENFAT